MGKCIFKTGVLIGAMTAAGGIATAKNTAIGYLAKVGPVPLRFQPRPTKIAILPPLPEDSPAPAANPSTPTPASDSNPIPDPKPGAPTESAPVEPPPPTAPLSDLLEEKNTDSLLPRVETPAMIPDEKPHSANDLLVITPQMLIDYFKPAGGSTTNTTGVSVLGPVNFMPPAPSTPPSSRAVYKTE